MLKVAMRRVADGEVDRLRSWMSELMQRRDEVVATFENEGVRHELAYLLPVTDGWILVYAMEMEDPERASAAFRASSLPIDHEHKQVMAKVLGAPVVIRVDLVPALHPRLQLITEEGQEVARAPIVAWSG